MNKYVFFILKLKFSLNNLKFYIILFLAFIDYQMKLLGGGVEICEIAHIQMCQSQQK